MLSKLCAWLACTTHQSYAQLALGKGAVCGRKQWIDRLLPQPVDLQSHLLLAGCLDLVANHDCVSHPTRSLQISE